MRGGSCLLLTGVLGCVEAADTCGGRLRGWNKGRQHGAVVRGLRRAMPLLGRES